MQWSRTLLFVHSIFNSLPLLIPNSQSFPPPLSSPLATTDLFSISGSLFLFHRYVHLYDILDSTYMWYHMIFIFLFLTYFHWYDNLFFLVWLFLYFVFYFLYYLMKFITFIDAQQSSQPNFIAFPSQTLSASPHLPTCLIWKP